MATFNDDQIQEMLRGRRAVRRVPFPGSEGRHHIGIRVLVDDEVDACRLAAVRYCKERGADLSADPEFLDREIQRQIVWRSTVDPDASGDDPPAFFPSFKDVRKLDTVTVEALFNAYLEHQEWVSPIRTLTVEQVRELVDALGKATLPEQALDDLSRDTLRLCVRSMASVLRESSPASN